MDILDVYIQCRVAIERLYMWRIEECSSVMTSTGEIKFSRWTKTSIREDGSPCQDRYSNNICWPCRNQLDKKPTLDQRKMIKLNTFNEPHTHPSALANNDRGSGRDTKREAAVNHWVGPVTRRPYNKFSSVSFST